MRCLVINLDRSPDRLVHMRGMFARIDIGFERVAAIDGTQCSGEMIEHINARNDWVRPMVRGEIGCFLSHRACWERIAAGDAPFGAVFEDDMLISADAAPLLDSLQWIPLGADIVKLETFKRPIVVSRKSLAATRGYELARLYSFHGGLGGYILSKQCAARLCLLTEQRAAPIDQLVLNPKYGVFDTLKVFQLIPAICIQERISGNGSTALSSSTIDLDGSLYSSDAAGIRSAATNGMGAARRRMHIVGSSVRRMLRGWKKIRVPYR